MLDMILEHDLAHGGGYQYRLADTRTPGGFDIALVNLTVPGGVDLARRLRSLPRALPVIGVGRRSNRLRGADDLLFSSFGRDILGVLNRAAETLTARAQQQALSRRTLSPLSSQVQVPEWAEMISRCQLRVLVIDPSPSSRSHVAVGLRQLGIDAEGVGSLVQASDVLSMRSYDLIIVDPVQPDGDGLEMLRRFKRATGSSVPVVVLSDRSNLSELLRSALAGCSGYLVKPLSLPALHATARRILMRHLYRRQRTAIGAIPMASNMSGKAMLPRLSWRIVVESVRARCVAGLAAVYDRCLCALRTESTSKGKGSTPHNRGAFDVPASRRGEGCDVDSLQLSPTAVPVWRPGGTHVLLDLKAVGTLPATDVVAPVVRAVASAPRREAVREPELA
ncbi:MAG: response regulator [Lautropia sp.]|nr:response regulator [Lautropia sp.]